MKRVVVLISGAGRNLQALIDAQRHGRLPDCLVGVISSRADAPGVQRFRAGDKCKATQRRRESTVTMQCGERERVVRADEPSQCHYALQVTSSAFCG